MTVVHQGSIVAGLILGISIVQPRETHAVPSSQLVCPSPPIPIVNESALPVDVCLPGQTNGVPFQFFDDFSWRSLVAMVWPAAAGQRGVPDISKQPGDSGPLVFETLKAEWELFRPNGVAPLPWDAFSQDSPCGPTAVGFGDLVLASFSKFGDLGQAGFGNLDHALPAQNKTWARYFTGFGRREYQHIATQKLYLRANLQNNPVTFSEGAVDVKAAWIDMANVAQPDRFHTRMALVMDPVTGTCDKRLVGLIGLHIVQKTPSRPQWIWSSFEQVDTVPESGAPLKGPYVLHDGLAAQMPATDPNIGFPPRNWSKPTVYNVQRLKPVASSTARTSAAYQKALGGKWQFYRLVLTQWPLEMTPGLPVPATQPGTPKFTFPGAGATTSFANTAMETWDQRTIATGCMNCHNLVQAKTDFLWSLEFNAFPIPPDLRPVSSLDKLSPIQELRQLLQRSRRRQ